MKMIGERMYQDLLRQSGIRRADTSDRIGNELTYVKAPLRTIVISLPVGHSKANVEDIIVRILSLEDEWLLIPRYGTASNLGFPECHAEEPAISFEASERQLLATYLCSRPMSLATATADLYVLSGSGRKLIVWDHHTDEAGLDVQLVDVDAASQLLVSLNEFGTELEVYPADHQAKSH